MIATPSQGVPTGPVLAAIDAALAADAPVTLDALGGLGAVVGAADALVVAPYADVLVRLAADADDGAAPALDALAVRALAESGSPTAFREAAAILVEHEGLRARLAPAAVRTLVRRVDARGPGAAGLLAAYAVEALFRLALVRAVSRHVALAPLAELSEADDALYAEHGAKLAGAAYHVWRDAELLTALDRLRRHPTAEAEAAYELGLAAVADALDGADAAAAAAGLEAARVHLADAAAAGDGRADADAYLAVVELIVLFARGAEPAAFDAPLAGLAAAVADRAHLLAKASLPVWLRPRADRDAQWAQLLETARGVAAMLERPSWIGAAAMLARLLGVYDADRTVAAGPGFAALVRPRIEAAFVREAGLRAHLDDLLHEGGPWAAEHGAVARALRARIAERAASEAPDPGKPFEDARHPLLSGVLGMTVSAAGILEAAADVLEHGLGEAARARDGAAHPVVQRILRATQPAFVGCPDYAGLTRGDFDALVLQVVLFCKDRQDAARRLLGARGAYLRNANAAEGDLQADLREYLVGNYRRGDLRTEVGDVAGGRADIYVGFGTHRFVIELKRHFGTVSPEAAREYRGQAASYQATDARLGMLGVLELVPRTGPPPALEECVWTDVFVPVGARLPRHLLVFRVPGNLVPPSTHSR